MTNSYNGWPGIKSTSDPRLTTIEPVPGRRFRVRAGDVATIFTHLIRRYHNEVEPINQGPLDDWGYAYRAVRGSSALSNHASATAVDLNATKHPFRTSASQNMTPGQIAACRKLVADFAPVIRWIEGSDPMHWEINYMSRGGTVGNVAALAHRLEAGEVNPQPTPPPPPVGRREPRPIAWKSVRGDLVRIIQEAAGVKADGVRGPKTITATMALQKRLGVRPDGLAGPVTVVAYLLAQPNLYRTKPDSEMRAPAVKLVQWIGGESPDGSFGAGTEKAVMEMQAWLGLPADGNVGADTKKRIVR